MPVIYYGEQDLTKDYFNERLVNNPPPVLGFDVETISLKERQPLGFSIATSPEESFYFNLYPEPEPDVELVKPLLQNPKIKKVAHNIPFDLKAIALEFPIDRTSIADTNVMARLLGRQFTKLENLAPEIGKFSGNAADLIKSYNGKTMLDVPNEARAKKCCNDTQICLGLYHEYLPQIDKEYFQVEMDVIPILIDMSLRGLKVHQADRAELEEKTRAEVEKYKAICEELDFNPGSPQQVGYILAKRGNFLRFTRSKKSLSTREEDLQFLDDPLAAVILNYRHTSKLLSTYLAPLAGEDRIYTEYSMDVSVGRVASSNRNMQNIPQNVRYIFMPDSGTFTTGDYCLAPNTLVLKSDLSWERIDCLNEGDELVGIDEFPEGGKGKRRKLNKTEVKRLSLVNKESYLIRMDDGREIVASGEHPWLVMDEVWHNSTAQHPEWVETKNIKPGAKIRQLSRTTWEHNRSYDAGYISGFMDGEGWIESGYHCTGFAQNEGETLELVIDKLRSLGFFPSRYTGGSSPTTQYKFTHMAEMLRFIGTIRPPRLMPKADSLWIGYEPPKLDAWAEVESVENAGVQELVAMETDSHTFVAEGLFTHNSQEHLRILMHNSGDRLMERVYLEGYMDGDIHSFTARELGITRYLAKTINYAIAYGATPKTISEQSKIKDIKKCAYFLEQWFKLFRDAAEWIYEAQRYGLRTGWALPTLFGRSIRIPEESEDGMKRKAVNYPILGSDGEVMKRALIVCSKLGLPLAVTVHDSITCDGDIEFPVEELEMIPGFKVPIDVKKTIRWE